MSILCSFIKERPVSIKRPGLYFLKKSLLKHLNVSRGNKMQPPCSGVSGTSKDQYYLNFNWLLMIYSIFCTTKVSPRRDHQVLKIKLEKMILDHHIVVVVVMIIGL